MTEDVWDTRYRESPRLFSGQPNPALVAEAADLAPGRALDLGCGEGADAHWLAEQGWQVTAVDVSRIALERAAVSTPNQLAGRITWTQADIAVNPPRAAGYDLVSAHYLPLLREHAAALEALVDSVAPGGTLLYVTHDLTGREPHPDFDPTDYHQHDDVRALLGAGWTVEVDGRRPRPGHSHHTHDLVLRARRGG